MTRIRPIQIRLTNTGEHQLSEKTFNMYIGLMVLWGLGLNLFMALFVPSSVFAFVKGYAFAAVYFGSIVLGILLCLFFRKAWVSFLGYNLVVIPFGGLLCLTIPAIEPGVLEVTVVQTFTSVVFMVALAMRFPSLVVGIGPLLFWALMGLTFRISLVS